MASALRDSSQNTRSKRGPKTDAGKAAVRLNAVRHGIVSSAVPLPAEDAAGWEAFRQGVIDHLAPVGAVEEELCRRIAELFWRLRRVAPYEADLAAAARERVPADFAKRHGWTRPESVEQAEELLDGAQEALGALGVRGDPTRSISEAAGDAFAAALEAAGDETTGADTSGWTPGLMQATVRALAAARGGKAEDVMRDVAGHLAARVEGRGRDLAFVLDEQDRMRRERFLPPEQSLINLAKTRPISTGSSFRRCTRLRRCSLAAPAGPCPSPASRSTLEGENSRTISPPGRPVASKRLSGTFSPPELPSRHPPHLPRTR